MLIQLQNNKPVTTSLQVAEYFGKQHSKVLNTIRTLLDNGADFGLVDYTDSKGEKRPMYLMDKSNFSLLAMSFTGQKALKFKIDYIKEFDRMERELAKPKELTRSDLARMILESEAEKEKLELENVKLASRNLVIKTKKEYKYVDELQKADLGRNINYYVDKYFWPYTDKQLTKPERMKQAHNRAKAEFRTATGINLPHNIRYATRELKATYLGWLSKYKV